MTKNFHECPSCVELGIQGSCARQRCYCGHPTCWAYDSYIPREHIQAALPKAIKHKLTEEERENRYK